MKAEHIKVVAFDVDGVFTDGTLYYGANGDCMKAFSARDGMGISMVKAAGLRTAIITGRSSQSVAKRAENLGITYVIQGSSYKKEGLAELCEKAQVTEKEVAYMGDDINDLPVIAAVGFSGAPQDACRQVREAVTGRFESFVNTFWRLGNSWTMLLLLIRAVRTSLNNKERSVR